MTAKLAILVGLSFILVPSLSAEEAFPVPQGFELQILEPTGGKIARPKGWFYVEQHGKH